MKRMRTMIFLMTFGTAGWLSDAPLLAADGVVSRAPMAGTNYCRLRFPAIREDTLYSSRPQLKDPKDGDMLEFYGPCDYDPLGIEQVRRQRADARRDRRTDDDD